METYTQWKWHCIRSNSLWALSLCEHRCSRCCRVNLQASSVVWHTVLPPVSQTWIDLTLPRTPHQYLAGSYYQSLTLGTYSGGVVLTCDVRLNISTERLDVSTLLSFRDLWKLRAEFFGISSSILSSCVSASYSLGLGQLPSKLLSPALPPPFRTTSTLLSCNLYLSPRLLQTGPQVYILSLLLHWERWQQERWSNERRNMTVWKARGRSYRTRWNTKKFWSYSIFTRRQFLSWMSGKIFVSMLLVS